MLIRQGILFSFTILFISLSFGVKVYEVHCNMRSETFVKILPGFDPCTASSEIHDESLSCCASSEKCKIQEENDENKCCSEEDLTISYEPDFFQQIIVNNLFCADFPLQTNYFSFPSVDHRNYVVNNYAKPPPKSGRDYLNLYAVLRI